MKIESSSIVMESSRRYSQTSREEETLRFWVGEGKRSPLDINANSGRPAVLEEDILDLSAEAEKMLAQMRSKAPAEEEVIEIEMSSEEEQRVYLIEKMLQALTGKKIRLKVPKKVRIHQDGSLAVDLGDKQLNLSARQTKGWGLVYDYHASYSEKERTSFQAVGVIKTSDGKEISISLTMEMSREFFMEENIHIRAGDAAVDPLVINFGGGAPNLSGERINFDLDMDGRQDRVFFVGNGSGFLALDANEDGVINDGSELFGPRSGDGFDELMAYDEDENGWIDEGDPIFDDLRIWTKDDQGNDILLALGEKGVGAIYLGSIATPFAIKDQSNQLQGQVQRTGIFIGEEDSAGTIQHIDIVV